MSVMSSISMSMHDGADHARAAAADEGHAAALEPRVEAVGVAGGHDGDPRRPFGDEARPIADDLAGADVLHGNERGCAATAPASAAASTRAAAARRRTAASPGRTRSYQTRESRSSAALFAAWTRRGRTPRAASCARTCSNRVRCCSISGCSGCRRSRSACRGRQLEVRARRSARAASAPGCRSAGPSRFIPVSIFR